MLALCACLLAAIVAVAAVSESSTAQAAVGTAQAAVSESAPAQEDGCDCVDVALTMEYLGATWTDPRNGIRRIGTSGSNRKMDVTVMNLGTRTAYDVEVVVDIVKPENSLWFQVPSVPIGRITSMGVATPAGTTSASAGGGYSIHWLIPELPGQASAKFEASARVYDADISKNPSVQTVNVSHDSMEFFGKVTTSSFERDDRKGNNSQRIWAHVTAAVSDNSYPAYGDYSIRSVSVDNPNPSPGDTVNFTVEAGAGSGAMIDMRVDIDLTDGLSVDTGGTISYTPASRASSLNYADGVFNIGSPKAGEARGPHSVTLPVMVASDATVSEQCLTATVTGNPPPGEGRPYSDDASDNVAKLCLGASALVPFRSGPVDAFTVYPCVGVTTGPCDSTNDVRVRAVNTSSGHILAPGTTIFHIDPTVARIYDALSGHSVNNGNTVSWQTAVNPALPYNDGLSSGVELYYSRSPFAGHESNWKRPTFGISARNSAGNKPPPGKVFLRFTFDGEAFRKAVSPNYEEVPTSLSSRAVTAVRFHYFLEFEKLGTYKIGWHVRVPRNSLHGSEDCHPNSATPPVNQAFCASETYTFHVGPMADLAVEDGGASPFVSADRNALAIIAVLNEPDRIAGATVTGLPTGRDVLHKSQGDYDATTGEWDTGELRPRDYYRSRGESEPILVLSAAAGDTASVSIAAPDYEVCIGPKSNPVDLAHTTKATCEAVSNASWNSVPVYDWNSANNTATITARAGAGPKDAPTLETMGSPDSIIVLKWEPVATVNGWPVSHYEVQKWVEGEEDWEDQEPGKVFGTMWVDAAPGEDPQYRARAVNGPGVPGAWSEPVFGKKVTAAGAGVEVDLDPDTAGQQHALTVDEGDELEYTIKLTSRPAYYAHVAVAADPGLTVETPPVASYFPPALKSGSLVAFHPVIWETVQKVKVTVDESLEIDDARTVKIRHTLPAGGGTNRRAGYADVTVPDLTLTVNDTTYRKAGFRSLGRKTLLLAAGDTLAYEIRPLVKPTQDVTITLASSDTAVATIDTDPDTPGSQKTITFRPGDFTAQRDTDTLPGTEFYAVPVNSPGPGPGRVWVTATGAGDADITITAVGGDLNFNQRLDEATQAVKVGATKPVVTAPVFNTAPTAQAATVNTAFSYTAPAATDAENDPITYAATLDDDAGSSLPGWLSFDDTTRAFTGTPTVCDAPATLPVRITATDDESPVPQTGTASFTLTVNGVSGGPAWHETVNAADYMRYAELNNAEPPLDKWYNRPPLALDGATKATLTLGLVDGELTFTPVGTVGACDPDGDPLRYIALEGTDAAAFVLDEDTGQLTTKAGETYDHGTKASYELTLFVEEQGTGNGYVAQTGVTVNLTTDVANVVGSSTPDVTGDGGSENGVTGDSGPTGPQQSPPVKKNRAPSFDPDVETTLALAENSPPGTNVGGPVAATDPDNDALTYSLSGADAASFAIDAATGQITAKTGVTYDYEAKPSYSLSVTASDGRGLSIATSVAVNLDNVNEQPAFPGASITLAVAENSPPGTNVGAAVAAADPDAGDTLTYSLSGTDAASFAIDSTGQLATKAGVTYDFEAKSAYSLTVQATDAGGLSDSVAVTVNLTDLAETPVTACRTTVETLPAAVSYAGAWDDAECAAHHQDGRARYFHFTPPADGAATVQVTVHLTAGTMYVSKDTPNNGWGAAPGGTHEQRRQVRRDNGKLLHDGNETAANTVTLTLEAGTTYTVEAAGADSGTFAVSLAPQ